MEWGGMNIRVKDGRQKATRREVKGNKGETVKAEIVITSSEKQRIQPDLIVYLLERLLHEEIMIISCEGWKPQAKHSQG
jgi:hypothetical protein